MKKVYIKFYRTSDLSTVRVTGAPKGFRDRLLMGLGTFQGNLFWDKNQEIQPLLNLCRLVLSQMKVDNYRIEYPYQDSRCWEKVIIEKDEDF